MPNTEKWDWLKEKTAEALVNSVVLGVVALIGYGILQAFIGDSKLEKANDKLRKEMIDKHNESITREAELLGKIIELKALIDKRADKPPEPDPPVALYAPSLAPPKLPNPAQETLDFERQHRLKYKE